MSAVERIAARAQRRLRGRVAAMLRDAVPGVAVHEEADGVVLEGRGLVRRMLRDARLRHVAGWWK